MRNIPGVFQWVIERVLSGLQWTYMTIILSNTIEKHLEKFQPQWEFTKDGALLGAYNLRKWSNY